jgi:hypothetical protein
MPTPRPYLSWSQFDLFKRNPEKYKEIYIYGAKNPVNRGMAYGRQMAEGLENGEATGDPVLDLLMERLPKFEIMDKAIECELKTGRGKEIIPILIKPDTLKTDMTGFKEYKTGQAEWTKKKADESGQITFYATGLFLKTGRIPVDIELVQVMTEKAVEGALDAKIGATGVIRRFPTVRTMSQILNMMVEMKKVWAGIKSLTEQELL